MIAEGILTVGQNAWVHNEFGLDATSEANRSREAIAGTAGTPHATAAEELALREACAATERTARVNGGGKDVARSFAASRAEPTEWSTSWAPSDGERIRRETVTRVAGAFYGRVIGNWPAVAAVRRRLAGRGDRGRRG